MTSPVDALTAPLDPLALLERDDKWFVSGAPALLYAPPFPLHDHRPGYWDPAHYLHYPIEPAFTFALIDERGVELPLTYQGRRWRPDRLTVTYTAPGVRVTETKVMGEHDALISHLHLEADADRHLQLLTWTAQPMSEGATPTLGEAGTATAAQQARGHAGYARRGTALALSRVVTGARQQQLELALALAVQDARSFSVNFSQSTANHPHHRLTPYVETLTGSGLPNEEKLTGIDGNGLMYLGIERPIALQAGRAAAVTIAASVARTRDAALSQAVDASNHPDPVGDAEARWRSYFADVPTFRCSDPYMEKYYYHRWYGLRLNTIRPEQGHYRHPVVCEGIGYFRLPISYSMQVLAREARWMRSSTLAHGILNTVLDAQTPNGTFPAHLYLEWRSEHEIYHADWAAAFEAVQSVHPLPDVRRLYDAFARYAGYFQAHRDAAGSGLFDIINQWETGQEYMTRYFAADPLADEWRDMRAPLKGVDATTYLYRLFRTLEALAVQLDTGEAARWHASAEHTRAALRALSWDPQLQAFCDLGPDGARTTALSVVNFYPYLTDIVDDTHLEGLTAHLLNPDEFWTPYPVPSSSQRDPNFSATPEWKGKRHNCPWNGRTWPMTNSHVADILARASQDQPALRATTADFITRYVHMMFEHHDLERPTAYEHYHPMTGHASTYRGVDDYMHSYVVDLIIRFVCGVQPNLDGLTIAPLPTDLDFTLEGVQVRGHTVSVHLNGPDGTVLLDQERHVVQRGKPLHLPFT